MQFTPIDKTNIAKISACYKTCTYKISDYSAGIKIMWQNAGYEYAEACGCLLVRGKWNGQYYFDYPVPLSKEADVVGRSTPAENTARKILFPSDSATCPPAPSAPC